MNSFYKRGHTLVELLIVISMLSILSSAAALTFVVGINAFADSYGRNDLRTRLSQGMERAVKNLRQAKSIDALSESSITFTADLGNSGDESVRLYLYHPDDAEPNPPYTESTYQLKWSQGVTTYGSGTVLSSGIAQPTGQAFSRNGNLISLDLTATDAEQSVRLRSNVRPRNL